MTFSITKNIFRYSILMLIPLLVSCGGGNNNSDAADGTVLLQLNPPENTKYLFTSDVKQNISIMGMANTQNMLMEYSYEVTGAEGNNKKIQIAYDRIKMDMSRMGQKMVYDSKDPNSDRSIFGAMDSLIGKPFVITIDPSGKVLNLEGWNTGGSRTLLDENAIKQMMETNFNIYPDNPVAVGDHWEKHITTNVQMMTMSVKARYTLEAINDGIALLKMEGDISMDQPTDSTKTNEAAMNMKISGTQSGTLHVELKTGRITTADIQQNIKGGMNMGGQEMPMEMSSDIKLSSKVL